MNRSERLKLLKNLGPAFRSNLFVPLRSIKRISTAIGASFLTSLSIGKLSYYNSWFIRTVMLRNDGAKRIYLHSIFLLLLLLIYIFLLNACISPSIQTQVITGETMGTTYSVKYVSDVQISKNNIDDLLVKINQSVSTYIPESTISLINQATPENSNTITLDSFFIDNFLLSQQIYEDTEGFFNTALMPLVNYWGFGYGEKNRNSVDTNEVNRLLALTKFTDFKYGQKQLTKSKKAQQLDFSAVAKGYGVDQIAELMNKQNIQHYLIEIGGELRAKGRNAENNWWRIAIDQPKKGLSRRSFQAILPLKNQAVATSGNYRNYRVVGDQEYGHIINPKTGFPEQKEIISATIIAETCAIADAYATACMVMGFEKAKQLVERNTALTSYFIYKNESGEIATYQSEAFEIMEM